jgi:hypothetical protein
MAIAEGADPIVRFASDKRGLLRPAVLGGHEQVLRFLLSIPRIREQKGFGRQLDDALSCAARRGWIRISELLFEHGAQIIPNWPIKSKPWIVAAKRGHVEVLQFLIDQCADLGDDKDVVEETIVKAEQRGYTAIVHMLRTKIIAQSTMNYASSCS